MKSLIFLALLILLSVKINAQVFCFYDPNIGPIYSNGSSGAIYDVTTGDFNSDSHLDIVTANSVGGNISFIPGYGNGTLGNPDTITTPGTVCIASGDFNGDTKLDVAAANSGNVFLLHGNGNGTFQPYTSYPAGDFPSRIYSVDINNDSLLDLVEAAGNGVFILIGQGNGVFSPAVQYIAGFQSNDITIADCDNDSILDIVSTTHVDGINSELTFLKGNGIGAFGVPVTLFSMTYPYNFIAGIVSEDINSDGNSDLVVANSSNNRIEIYSGNGSGTFNAPVFYSTFYNPFYIYLADFDNDLVKDVIVEESNGFSILKGNSDGTFNTYQYFLAMSTPNALAIEDFNEDGKTDVIIPSSYFGSPLIAMNLNCTITGIDYDFQNTNASVNIFPNPFSTFTSIQFSSTIKNMELNFYNIFGQKIKTINNIPGQEYKLYRDNLPSGLYLILLTQAGRIIATDKLVITD